MESFSRRICAVVALTALSATASAARQDEPLDLAEAVALAASDQPRVTAIEHERQAALEAARAESELPDPRLIAGVQNLPVTEDAAFRLDREDMTMVGVGLMQEVVTRNKRAASESLMTTEASRLAAEANSVRRAIRRDTALAWLDALAASRRAQMYQQLANETAAEREVAAARLSSDGASASEIMQLDASLSMFRTRAIAAQGAERRARAELFRWIGDDAFRPLAGDVPAHGQTVASYESQLGALDAHPMLAAASLGVEVALRAADRARADRAPDWSWELMYGTRQDDRSDMVTFQVAIDLPFNRRDRQDRRIAEKLALAEQARSEMLDRRRELQAELRAVIAELQENDAMLEEHGKRFLAAARAQLATAQAAYAGTRGSLTEVWEARRMLLEGEIEHEIMHIERERTLARLAYLVGEMEAAP